jgi:hypothetical protein
VRQRPPDVLSVPCGTVPLMAQQQVNPTAVVITGSVWSAAFILAFAGGRPGVALALLALHALVLLVSDAVTSRR